MYVIHNDELMIGFSHAPSFARSLVRSLAFSLACYLNSIDVYA